jgi:hypothetical protein
MRLSASGLLVQTFALLEVDLSLAQKAMSSETSHTAESQPRLQWGLDLPLDLEELDRRLEAALFPMSDLHADEPCVWACACFLVDGS